MIALFLGFCLGHLVLMVGAHNWCYGQRFGKRTMKAVHLLFGALTAAVPPLLWWGCDLDALFIPTPEAGLGWVGTVYAWLAVLAGLGWLPLVTAYRALRQEPVVTRRCEVVDVARVLGHKPVGRSRHAALGQLPYNEIYHIEYSEKALSPARLPAAWDGLTILHLSDLHLHGTPDRDWYRVILDRCANWHPDLVCITGDIADSYPHQRWIVPLLGRLRWRCAAIAILGNHDYRYDAPFIRRRLRRLGMHVPGNGWLKLEVRGAPLVVIGHEGPWLEGEPDLAGCPEGPFRLCLSHTPDHIRWARQAGVDLMLAGHVHGGQIRFPLFGSMLVPSAYGRRYDCGAFDVPPTLLHVSRGLSGEHPVRYNCKPEVTLLTLRQKDLG
jgi:predicted MPP superfamily phosphohydrolase